MIVRRRCAALALLLLGLGGSPAAAVDQGLERFFGTYEGQSLFPADEVGQRTLHVVIRPFEESGFAVEWRTAIEETLTDKRVNEQALVFRPAAADPRLFQAQRGDVAEADSADPLDGRPFAWAAINGEVLSIHVLTVTEDGHYVMQSYHRALTGRGMTLSFVRVRNGAVEKMIWGSLDRVADR